MTAVVLVRLRMWGENRHQALHCMPMRVGHAVMLYTLAGSRGSLEPDAPLGISVVRSSMHDALIHVAHSVQCKRLGACRCGALLGAIRP